MPWNTGIRDLSERIIRIIFYNGNCFMFQTMVRFFMKQRSRENMFEYDDNYSN